ncbi:hypothetical protein C7974DRAFT_174724 [Boeremia exigua]|uniref:uncharacterized protein n=1 Tax=Boeremia exigua TaxID=749465 RepID=UPI001E8E8D04|nr:uncharacterized protein C7974DRAFT_174724 [Boeremia exigua]KAH6633579.1 hypothetical protein C7974DRAFT_174724 [Boeremia exigua]
MLSPNSIPSKKTGRNLSTWSIDSGYGSGIHEDAKLGSILDARDVTPRGSVAMSQPQSRSVGLGISRLSNLNTGDDILIKKEECTFAPSTPRLRVCTTVSNPSSPDPVSPASPSEVRRSHARKSASKLPSQAVRRLTAWLDTNRHHPYPSAETKQALAEACSITIKQVTTWFTNIRQRQLKTQEDDTERLGNNHAQISHQGSRKGKKKDYSRSNGASPIEGFLSPPRLSPSASISEHSSGEGEAWQCTFCGVSLTAKSWRRHEETQHHPKHQWTCLAHGPRIQLSISSESICAFCELKNPNEDHFRFFHRIGDCLCKPEQERTFGRPDHLQQHARNFHKCDQPLSELVRDTWRRDGPGMIDNKSWTCGFCHEELRTWDARATHIAGHFKSGLTMAQWRADRVLQSSLPEDDFQFSAPTALNALASMEVTLAGPSNIMSGPPNYGRPHPMQQMQAQPIPASTMMPVATTVPDFDFDPFGAYYGNPIDTFNPSLPTSASYYPVVSNVPAAAQNGVVSPMDYGVIGFDEFGAPVYDMSGMHSW